MDCADLQAAGVPPCRLGCCHLGQIRRAQWPNLTPWCAQGDPLGVAGTSARPRGDGRHPAYPPPLEKPCLPEPYRPDALEAEHAELAALRDLDADIWRSRCRELMRRVGELEAELNSAAARKEEAR